MPNQHVTAQGAFGPLPTATPSPTGTPGPSPTPVPSPTPSPTPRPWNNPFPDVSDTAWYIQAVEYVCVRGLMNGYANGTFGPQDSLSRAQFAQILYNREGRPTPGQGKEGPFQDVKPGRWYAQAVHWAGAEGIVTGYGQGMFGPNDPITREQLAVMLWRYGGSPLPEKTGLDYPDADKISAYAWQALCWASEQEILLGRPGKIADPQGTTTRAEAAQMLQRYFEKAEAKAR